MEINTRLQVEHPVTEMITGQDLVEWQLRVAAGEPLPLAQEDLAIRGHALEARIYAEDPDRGFLPSTGRLVHLAPPAASPHVRIDSGVEQGDEITPWYDPMIAKLIVWDDTRERALARMHAALADYRIVGVANNIEFLGRLVTSPAFAAADLDTGLIERERDVLFPAHRPAPAVALQAAAVALLDGEARRAMRRAGDGSDPWSPWAAGDAFRLNGLWQRRLVFRDGDVERAVLVEYAGDGYVVTVDDDRAHVSARVRDDGGLVLSVDGRRCEAHVIAQGERRHVFVGGAAYPLLFVDPLAAAGEAHGVDGGFAAPMPGKVIAWLADAGTDVAKGTPLLILEAMKMEHTITAPVAGRLERFRFAVGEQVTEGADLVEFTAAAK